MSISRVKELFYLATNAKMVVGGEPKQQIRMLREALAISKDLNDELWPYVPAYRLAHLLFREAKSEADFNEIIDLLKHAEKSASSYISVNSLMLKFIAFHRQKMLGVGDMTDALQECLENILGRIQNLQRYGITTNDWNRPMQGDYFNILEYLLYATGVDYDRLVGVGYDDRNTLFPGRNNDVWRIVSLKNENLENEIDDFHYNYETGFLELQRLVKEEKPHCYFVFGDPRETYLINSSEQKDESYPRTQLLLRLLVHSPHGEDVSQFSKLWGHDGKPAAKDARRDLDKFIGGMLFQPNLRRWAIRSECKIFGLVNIDKLAEARRDIIVR